jgi:DHA1 family bicyclomycin/chloramphenicol resistance-like MFS transporter
VPPSSSPATLDPKKAPVSGPLPTWELVSMVAGLMALNALAIDLMLPALGIIAGDLDVSNPNDRQLVVVAYILGIGAPQLVFGPISDRFGRRPALFISLAGYAVAGVACAMAESFTLLLAMRFVQGVFASGCRVVSVTVVRDLYAGRGMARIMSLVMTVFMVVPILAPALGQLVLFVAPWQWCFYVLVLAGVAMFAWVFVRLPETLSVSARRPLDFATTFGAYRMIVRSRVTLGYMLAGGVIFGSLFAFVSSAEQIFREVFGQEETFVLWFAAIATMLSVANYANARLVERFGMRRLSHVALVGFTVVAVLLWLAMRFVGEELWLFFPLFGTMFAFFGLIGTNFNALAMEPLGEIAGTASSAFGFTTTTLSGVIGGAIGRQYDGTTMPILLGFVVLGVLAFVIVAISERGRLFAGE